MPTADTADFRFSPRPNTAGRIGWQPWGTAAFARARAERKPVLLSISAVWCHWCHVMDETTYSDAAVHAIVAERFVAVRIDADRRPDLDARYNMGGWPTTAVLDAAGETIAGATYIPPDRMRAFLEQVADYVATPGDAAGTTPPVPQAETPRDAPDRALDAGLITRVRDALVATYDPEFGGFGVEPKFPQTDALEFLLRDVRLARRDGEDARERYDLLARTALAMGRGGIFDPVDGGFFRYATRRDWSRPHVEKLAADQGAYLRLYAGLYRLSGNDAFRTTLVSVARYVRDILRDPPTGRIAGSQDADEAYVATPPDERRALAPPAVDRRMYTASAANVASGCFAAAMALSDDALVAMGCAALEAILRDACVDADGLARHVVDEDGSTHVRGLLEDQAWLLAALLDAHALTGEERWLHRAVALGDAALAAFPAAGSGAFADRVPDDDDTGRLVRPEFPLRTNGVLADALLRLSVCVDDDCYADAARRVLRALDAAARRAGPFAAPLAMALARARRVPVVITLVGDAVTTAALRSAALAHPDPIVVVRTLDPRSQLLERSGLPPEPGRAFACIGTRCERFS